MEMATKSRIGIMGEDGRITSVYCHNEGHPENVGKVLQYHYRNEQKIRKMISNGSLSHLRRDINPNSDYPHDGQNPQDNVCVFYIRDWGGGSFDHEQTHECLEDFKRACYQGSVSFGYLYRDGEWYYYASWDGYIKETPLGEYLEGKAGAKPS